MSSIDLLKHDGRVPRYTSYPTAAQFHPGIGPGAARQWLSQLDADEPVALYLHVPYCRSLCWYCACHARVLNNAGGLARYADLLAREADILADALPARLKLAAVQWGGGTPNTLPPAAFLKVMERLRARYDFRADTEIAVEIDPRCLESAMARALGEAGVNRASIGVQDFDPGVQKAIHREQSFAETAAAVARLRGAGVERLNVDMVYGLPGQTLSGMLSTIDQVMELEPQRLALFGYAHVPWHQPRQNLIPEWMLPGAVERLELFAAAAERLESSGFLRIALDHFARDDDPLSQAAAEGRLRRTFQGYTDVCAETVLGIGASAISTLPAGLAQNAVPPADYGAAIRSGELATARGVARGGDDGARGAVIERLMCDFRVDLPQVAARYGLAADSFDGATARLAPLIAEGLVRMRGGELVVAPAGRPLVRTVCAAFDRYWKAEQGPARHARAL